MQHVLREATLFAPIPRPIALIGGTGVGKGTIASFIHTASGRPGPFVVVTGGQVSDGILHSQLFGHEKGAFTGAVGRSPGALERATGGTLFIDELPHWSHAAQAAMLRPLAERRFQTLGTAREVDVTARVIVGSTAPLEELERRGALLPDLRHRLQFIEIEIPALDQRRADVLPIAEVALTGARTEFHLDLPRRLGASAVQSLLTRAWPGNVRELRWTVEVAAVRANDERNPWLEQRHLKPTEERRNWFEGADEDTKRAAAQWAVEQTSGHRGEAALLLGIHRNTIRRFLQEPGVGFDPRRAVDSCHGTGPEPPAAPLDPPALSA